MTGQDRVDANKRSVGIFPMRREHLLVTRLTHLEIPASLDNQSTLEEVGDDTAMYM